MLQQRLSYSSQRLIEGSVLAVEEESNQWAGVVHLCDEAFGKLVAFWTLEDEAEVDDDALDERTVSHCKG